MTEFLEDVSNRLAIHVALAIHNKADTIFDTRLSQHPGGKKILLKNCGKDASESFWTYHSEKILTKTAQPYLIGDLKDAAKL